jgi:ubiquinone/menaquinone biosynthesis C-methylase UbiE
MMKTQEKPKYGFVAWKYFACMGAIGFVGLAAVLMTFQFPLGLLVTWSLRLVGAPIAFVGLYMGISYIFLYEKAFKSRGDVWSRIVEFSQLKGDEEILEVGCGTGSGSINLAKKLPKAKIVGIDIFEGVSGKSPDTALKNAQIEGVADRVNFRYGNALKIPYQDKTFDVVTMGSVLHELHSEKDKTKALREIYRVLRPGGKFITLELVRNKKLALCVLVFAPVWKPKEYWPPLIERAGFRNVVTHTFRSLISFAVFTAEKPSN